MLGILFGVMIFIEIVDLSKQNLIINVITVSFIASILNPLIWLQELKGKKKFTTKLCCHVQRNNRDLIKNNQSSIK